MLLRSLLHVLVALAVQESASSPPEIREGIPLALELRIPERAEGSRIAEAACSFRSEETGQIFLYVRPATLRTILRIQDETGRGFEDRGPPAQVTPYLTPTVREDERYSIRVLAANEGETGTVVLVLHTSRETEATRAAAERARAWLSAPGEVDPRSARRAMEGRIAELMDVPGAEKSAEIHEALWGLVRPAFEAGALDAALAACGRVFAFYEPKLPQDHRFLQNVRMAQGIVVKGQGRAAEALALEELALAAFERTVPPEHPDRLKTLLNSSASLRELGRFEEAVRRAEAGREIALRAFPPEHPVVVQARHMVASLAREAGDPERALSEFAELEAVYRRQLPEDAPDIQELRLEIAAAWSDLGDFERALSLEEAVLEIYERAKDPEGTDLQMARMNLAVTLYHLNDIERARSLYEDVLEARSRTLPEDSLELQMVRLNLGALLLDVGEVPEARGLLEAASEVFARRLPPEHPLLLSARSNLGVALVAAGEVEAAVPIFEEVLRIRERTCPADSFTLLRSGQRLAFALLAAGDRERARALLDLGFRAMDRLPLSGAVESFWRSHGLFLAAKLDLPDAARAKAGAVEGLRALDRGLVDSIRGATPREVEARIERASALLDAFLTLMEEGAPLADDPDLATAAFAVVERIRGAGLASARELRRARLDPEFARLRSSLALATARVARFALEEREDARWRAALEAKGRLERRILAHRPPGDPRSAPSEGGIAGLAARLAPEEAVVAFRLRPSLRLGPLHESGPPRLLAFVLRAGGPPRLVDLGPEAPIGAAVARWRRALENSGAGSVRGVARVVSSSVEGERESGEALRRLVFDPVLLHLGGARRLLVALDDPLHLIPMDALPDGTERLGDRYEIRQRASLEVDPPSPPGEGVLLAVGGVDYGRDEGEPVPIRSAVREWSPPHFPPLPATREEIDAIAALHGRTFGGAPGAVRLHDDGATKDRLRELAPQARFLHLATHGAYAPESVPSGSVRRPLDARLDLELFRSRERAVLRRSPMVLCGLALSGANLPTAGEEGRAGFITAEEIADLDLLRCELAVLSACETSAGVPRSGQGLASIQRAFHMAGARTVIASLWSVPDEAARELMADFYRRIWVEGIPKHRALWEAKRAMARRADEKGAPRFSPRDWAGWVLTGEP